jgi:hypothetical protein
MALNLEALHTDFKAGQHVANQLEQELAYLREKGLVHAHGRADPRKWQMSTVFAQALVFTNLLRLVREGKVRRVKVG